MLVVEDSARMAKSYEKGLGEEGYVVTLAGDGQTGLELARGGDFDLVILDVNLPGGLDGFDVVRRLRQARSDVPVIMVTARDSVEDRIEGLDGGADDYVTKPFSTPELLARLRVALRRQRSEGGAVDPVLHVGDLVVDVPHHAVAIGDVEIDLTPKEFAFLALLARHPGRVLTHRAILQAVWGPEYGSETQYLRVYASQIRKKLGEDPSAPRLVTEPGVGYRLVDPTP